MSDFEKVGRIELSGSRQSLKIILITGEEFYVSLKDVKRCINEPKFSATIVKIK